MPRKFPARCPACPGSRDDWRRPPRQSRPRGRRFRCPRRWCRKAPSAKQSLPPEQPRPQNLSTSCKQLSCAKSRPTPKTNSHNSPARQFRSRELAQKAHIVLEKRLNVVDAVLEHGQPVDADTKREAAYFLGIVVHEAIDRGIHHARAKKFDPGRALALAASAAGIGR